MESNGDEQIVRLGSEVDMASASGDAAIAPRTRRGKGRGWLIVIGAVLVLCLLGRTAGALYSGFVTNATDLSETPSTIDLTVPPAKLDTYRASNP